MIAKHCRYKVLRSGKGYNDNYFSAKIWTAKIDCLLGAPFNQIYFHMLLFWNDNILDTAWHVQLADR